MLHFSLLPSCCFCQVEECHLPGLGVALTLDYRPDAADEAVSPLVSYVSGLLLGTNSKVRTWFSMFIHNGQQVNLFFILFTNNHNGFPSITSPTFSDHHKPLCISIHFFHPFFFY